MRIGVDECGNIEFQEVFNSICFKTANGQILAVCMRDEGFEIGITDPTSIGKGLNWYSANNGNILPLTCMDSNA